MLEKDVVSGSVWTDTFLGVSSEWLQLCWVATAATEACRFANSAMSV